MLGAGAYALSWGSTPCEEHRAEHDVSDDAEAADVLTGLWTRYQATGEGEPVRLYYFHGDGHGLYRYGKVGLNKTESFDYEIEGGLLQLEFRKRGEKHATRFLIADDAQGRYLELADDPRDSGVRYRRRRGALTGAELAVPDPQGVTQDDASGHAPLGGRFWIDYGPYATGGSGFGIYQLGPTALDGRGVGWFHRGDFDDWSTETLTYRIDGESLELFFDLSEQGFSSRFSIEPSQGGRVLRLEQDPRDYWASHEYKDGGESFSAGAFGLVVGAAYELGAADADH